MASSNFKTVDELTPASWRKAKGDYIGLPQSAALDYFMPTLTAASSAPLQKEKVNQRMAFFAGNNTPRGGDKFAPQQAPKGKSPKRGIGHKIAMKQMGK